MRGKTTVPKKKACWGVTTPSRRSSAHVRAVFASFVGWLAATTWYALLAAIVGIPPSSGHSLLKPVVLRPAPYFVGRGTVDGPESPGENTVWGTECSQVLTITP